MICSKVRSCKFCFNALVGFKLIQMHTINVVLKYLVYYGVHVS